MVDPSGLEQLLAEFDELGFNDRRRILRRLTRRNREAFLDALERQKTKSYNVKEPLVQEGGNKSPFAQWIQALPDPEKRAGFPALRNNFSLTSRANRSLQEAMAVIRGQDSKNLDKVDFLGRDDDSIVPPHGPSLMSKMSRMLSRKMMLL